MSFEHLVGRTIAWTKKHSKRDRSTDKTNKQTNQVVLLDVSLELRTEVSPSGDELGQVVHHFHYHVVLVLVLHLHLDLDLEERHSRTTTNQQRVIDSTHPSIHPVS